MLILISFDKSMGFLLMLSLNPAAWGIEDSTILNLSNLKWAEVKILFYIRYPQKML
jgi:hypothetical protein